MAAQSHRGATVREANGVALPRPLAPAISRSVTTTKWVVRGSFFDSKGVCEPPSNAAQMGGGGHEEAHEREWMKSMLQGIWKHVFKQCLIFCIYNRRVLDVDSLPTIRVNCYRDQF